MKLLENLFNCLGFILTIVTLIAVPIVGYIHLLMFSWMHPVLGLIGFIGICSMLWFYYNEVTEEEENDE